MKKRMLSLVLSLGIAASFMSGCSENPTQKESAAVQDEISVTEENNVTASVDFVTLYTDFITENKENRSINYIGLNDLNFDGVPELMLSDSAASAAYSLAVFHIENDEVKLLYSYSSIASDTYMTEAEPVFYSNFHDNWLTLRKNVNTGELRYFLVSSNGSGSESFGDTFSFPVNEKKEIGLATETGYVILYDDETFEMTDEFYYVLGEEVSKDKYQQAQAELDATWEDTGIRTPAMALSPFDYSNAIELSLEREDLQALFRMYEKEYE